MKPDDLFARELKDRFASLRAAEARNDPSFSRTLAAARSRPARSRPARSRAAQSHPSLPLWSLAAVAGLAALAFLVVARIDPPAPNASLAETLPVLLAPSSGPGALFPAPLFANSGLPSDSVLPLSSRFPL